MSLPFLPRLRAALLLGLCGLAALAHASPVLEARLAALTAQASSQPARALTELKVLESEAIAAGPALQRRYLASYGYILALQGDSAGAHKLAEQLLRLGEAQGMKDALAAGRLLHAHAEHLSGQTYAAFDQLDKAQALIKPEAAPELRFWLHSVAGTLHFSVGDFEQALRHFQDGLETARGMGDEARQIRMLGNLASLDTAMRQADRSLPRLDEALQIAARTGDLEAQANLKLSQANAHAALGHRNEHFEALQEGLRLSRRAGAHGLEATFLTNLSDYYLRVRDYAAVLRTLEQAKQLGATTSDWERQATLDINAGLASIQTGKLAAGRALVEQALRVFENRGARHDTAQTLREYGEALRAAGQLSAALEVLTRERRLNDELFQSERQRTLLELQAKYAAREREQEIELLNRDNAFKTAELKARKLEQRVWWLTALAFALIAALVGLLYGRLILAHRNLAAKTEELTFHSHRDPLTKLYNRRYFQLLMQQADAAPGRRPADALYLIDLDHFKRINDRLGHAAGDAVLIEVAQRLQSSLRRDDVVVRWGGEEFLVYAPHVASDDVTRLARAIMSTIAERPVSHQGREIAVTASVGYAGSPLREGSEHLPWMHRIRLIDTALYLAKAHGRSRAYGIRRINSEDGAALEHMEQDLEEAWNSGQVELEVSIGMPAQPIA